MPQPLEQRLEEIHPASFGWALGCCGWDRQEAEEVLQTTYLKILEGRARFDERSSFKTWLFAAQPRSTTSTPPMAGSPGKPTSA